MASDSSYEFDLAGAVVAVPGRLLSRTILLWISYVGLVSVTAWTAWNTERALDRIEEEVCANAEIAIGSAVFNIDIYGEQPGVDDEAVRSALDTLLAFAEAVQNRCGLTFLDEIELQR